MTSLQTPSEWLMLTPAGALQAFAHQSPTESDKALQDLLNSDTAPDIHAWRSVSGRTEDWLLSAVQAGWVQRLQQPMAGPDARLDDFLQHVVGSLSGERKAALGSESGFCLGRCGLDVDEAETLCAAAADYFDYAKRQTRRGWNIAASYASFHSEPHLLLPTHTFVPLWVDGQGYWLVILGEPLLNNLALVELLWGIKLAGSRFGRLDS